MKGLDFGNTQNIRARKTNKYDSTQLVLTFRSKEDDEYNQTIVIRRIFSKKEKSSYNDFLY